MNCNSRNGAISIERQIVNDLDMFKDLKVKKKKVHF